MTILLARAAPTAAVPAPAPAPATAVTTEVSVAVTLIAPAEWTLEPFEKWAEVLLTTTLTETEPPSANVPAPARPTVTAVTTAAEEASNFTPEADFTAEWST